LFQNLFSCNQNFLGLVNQGKIFTHANLLGLNIFLHTTKTQTNIKMSGTKKLIPLLDRVIIKRIKSEPKAVGAVLLPESAQNKDNPQGLVVAVGHGTEGMCNYF